ncbi:hypothetical protein [Ilumatobacter sp.]|uniref:hypothetical protein n=1 Tax=Ilumatobacter sp. TaxID=1967498 RepID=UPI0037522EDF
MSYLSDDFSDGSVREIFDAMLEADQSLDQVVSDLRAVGLVVGEGQRHIVVRWLDVFSINTPVPLAMRLAMLSGWLSA